MPNYTVEDLKKLREATSLGMIECKKILEEAGGDYKKALELISQADNEKAAKAKAAADHDLEISRGIAEKRKNREQEVEDKLREKKSSETIMKNSAQVSQLQSEVEILKREVMALKKAHNELLAALEKASKAPGRATTSYTSFYMGEF